MPPQPSKSLCVVDANIIIDLHIGALLDHLFSLPYTPATPRSIISKQQRPPGYSVVKMGLIPLDLSETQICETSSFRKQYPRLAIDDIHAFILAHDLSVPLLTGDSGLRRLAQSTGLSVYGTLWVLDTLVQQNTISRQQAATSLNLMTQNSRRLPASEVMVRLNR